jgi:4'-phosphopantetheinyl transferase
MSLEPACDAAALLWPLLDEAEQSRAARFHFEPDRDAYVAAHALLRLMLSREADVAPHNWRLRVLPGGKPQIDPSHGCDDLRFSLSHTRGMVACAVGRRHDLGVDVEQCDPAFPAPEMARTLFAPPEIERLADVPPAERNTIFYRLWTLKEAYLKAIGQGIGFPMQGHSFCLDPVAINFSLLSADAADMWQFSEFVPGPRHRLALAVRRAVADPVRLDATPMSLLACAAQAAARR